MSSTSDKSSLTDIVKWNDYIIRQGKIFEDAKKALLINNKSNVNRDVELEEIQEVASKLDIPYFILSSLDKSSVDYFISEILDMLKLSVQFTFKSQVSSVLQSLDDTQIIISSRNLDNSQLDNDNLNNRRTLQSTKFYTESNTDFNKDFLKNTINKDNPTQMNSNTSNTFANPNTQEQKDFEFIKYQDDNRNLLNCKEKEYKGNYLNNQGKPMEVVEGSSNKGNGNKRKSSNSSNNSNGKGKQGAREGKRKNSNVNQTDGNCCSSCIIM